MTSSEALVIMNTITGSVVHAAADLQLYGWQDKPWDTPTTDMDASTTQAKWDHTDRVHSASQLAAVINTQLRYRGTEGIYSNFPSCMAGPETS